MADISKLKGVTAEETDKLRTAGVETVEQLWLRISEEQDNGLGNLATQTGITRDRLMDLLADEGLRNARRFGSSWLTQHWLDFVLVAGLLILVALVWRITF